MKRIFILNMIALMSLAVMSFFSMAPDCGGDTGTDLPTIDEETEMVEGDPPHPYALQETDCTDGEDNDGDGDIDCPDSDCESDPACVGCYYPDPETGCPDGTSLSDGMCSEVMCQDQTDNDCDGKTDCADSDCEYDCGYCYIQGELICPTSGTNTIDGVCTEFMCFDQVDNDCDGKTDCADSDCEEKQVGGGIVCPAVPENICYDDIDNDNDDGILGYLEGGIDCEDIDCNGLVGDDYLNALCEFGTELTCDDGFNNDADVWFPGASHPGGTDCEDIDCIGEVGGPSGQLCERIERSCDDGFDNDVDEGLSVGGTDCADASCNFHHACGGTEATCDDGVDNDLDGLVDCADTDCAAECR